MGRPCGPRNNFKNLSLFCHISCRVCQTGTSGKICYFMVCRSTYSFSSKEHFLFVFISLHQGLMFVPIYNKARKLQGGKRNACQKGSCASRVFFKMFPWPLFPTGIIPASRGGRKNNPLPAIACYR